MQETQRIDLWSQAQSEQQSFMKQSQVEKTVVFVGDQGSGKSSLINLLKGNLNEELVTPTQGFEYTILKQKSGNSKKMVQVYEVGGGKTLKEIAQLPLNRQNAENYVYVIVLDLQNPSGIMDSLKFWIENIQENTEKQLQTIFQNDQISLNRIRQNLNQKFEKSQDQKLINPMVVNTILLLNKYDKFEQYETENRKWMSRILRYICNKHGISLYYSTCNRGVQLSSQIKSLLNTYFFTGDLPDLMQKDHNKPLFITAGLDNFDSMQIPVTSSNMSTNEILKKLFTEYFPKETKNQFESKIKVNNNQKQMQEQKIDQTNIIYKKQLKKAYPQLQFDSDNEQNNQSEESDSEQTKQIEEMRAEIKSNQMQQQEPQQQQRYNFKANTSIRPQVNNKSFINETNKQQLTSVAPVNFKKFRPVKN